MAAYLPTLNPVFRADDSPETITAAVQLGIQHPPGYPLHTLIGHLFTKIALASPAFRLNFMAAFFASLSCAALSAILFALLLFHPDFKRLSSSWLIAAAASLLGGLYLAFSHTFWTQALAAKGSIYSLHSFLILCQAACLLAWDIQHDDRYPSRPPVDWPWYKRPLSSLMRLLHYVALNLRRLHHRFFYLFCLLAGLAMGNHLETQKVILLLALLFIGTRLSQGRPDPSLPKKRYVFKPLFYGIALLLTGFSVYLLLPLRAASDPAMNWGDPVTWERFKWVFQRQQYLDLETGFLKAFTAWIFKSGPWSMVTDTWIFITRQGSRVFTQLIQHPLIGYPALFLSLLGLLQIIRLRAWTTFVLFGGMAFIFSTAITFYFQLKPEMLWIQDVFLIPAFIAQAFLASLGLAWILSLLQTRKIPPWLSQTLIFGLTSLFLLSTLLHASKTAANVSQRGQYWAYDFARDFLDFNEKNSIILAEGDFNTMPIYYLQYVEGRRRDIIHLTTIFLSVDWGIEQVKQRYPQLGITAMPRPQKNKRQGDGALLLQAVNQILSYAQATGNALQASLFREVLKANVPSLESGFKPHGLTARYFSPPLGEGPHFQKYRRGLLQAMRSRYWSVDRNKLEDSPAFALSNYAAAWMDLGVKRRSQGKLDESIYLFEVASRLATHPNLAQAYTHLGIAYSAKGDLNTAAQCFLKAVQEKPIFEAWTNLAGTYNQLKRYGEAETAARKAIAINHQASQNWNNLGIALFYQNKGKEAIKSLEIGLQVDKNNIQLRNNLNSIRKIVNK